MKKKGFSLIELIIIIAIMGLLIALAVPASLTISKKIKQNMLDAKIEMIESSLVIWAQNNKEIFSDYDSCYKNKVNASSNITQCYSTLIGDLVNNYEIFDEDRIVDGDKQLINPITNESINACNVEIFVKNNRVYAEYITDDVGSTKCYYDTTIIDTPVENILLLDALKNNQPNGTTTTVPGQETSDMSEARIIETEDDYGISYVYRGNVTNNYVNYSGMCWRVLRVQGNGTIKLVLEDENMECDNESYDPDSPNAFANEGEKIAYINEFSSETSLFLFETSNIPSFLADWASSKNLDMSDLVEAEWCNDTSVKNIIVYDETAQEIGKYYGAYDRIEEQANPSLKCDSTGVEGTTGIESKATIYRNKLGILSADEIVFAGDNYRGWLDTPIYYLSKPSNSSFWTMSPYNLDPGNNYIYDSISMTQAYYADNYVRPSIVLNSNVTVLDNANGTYENPYEIN